MAERQRQKGTCCRLWSSSAREATLPRSLARARSSYWLVLGVIGYIGLLGGYWVHWVNCCGGLRWCQPAAYGPLSPESWAVSTA